MTCTTWLIRNGNLIIRDGDQLVLCEDVAVVEPVVVVPSSGAGVGAGGRMRQEREQRKKDVDITVAMLIMLNE